MPDNPNDSLNWLEAATAEHLQDCRDRLTAIQDSKEQFAELFAKENALKAELRAWDFSVAFWGDEFSEFVKRYGLDYKIDDTTIRATWDRFLKEVSKKREPIIAEIQKVLDEKHKLCRKLGIKYQ